MDAPFRQGVEKPVEDVKPKKFTKKQMAKRPGLCSRRSLSLSIYIHIYIYIYIYMYVYHIYIYIYI